MRRQPTSNEGREAPPDIARQQLRSYGAILGLFVFLLAISLCASWGAITIVDSTRAYVNGEGRYSKAEKIAVLSLHRYAYSRRPEDYRHFLEAIAVPLGDHAARLAMEARSRDARLAEEGFIRGENHPADIPGMIRLFHLASWWPPFARALEDWRAGDVLTAALIAEGERLHALNPSYAGDRNLRARILNRIDALDAQLTLLENHFSTHLGEATRQATALVMMALGATMVLLWAVGTALAARLLRRQLALHRQLVAGERRFRDFAEVASDWYWEMDADNRATYVSKRFEEIIGRPVESVLGLDCHAFVREQATTPDQRRTYLAAVEQQKEFRGIQVWNKHPSGEVRYWSISGKPHRGIAGEFLGYRGVGSDVTETVRDALLLREAKTRAEDANRAKTHFLANMSHELRTPLNAILGFSDIIKDRMLGPDAFDRYCEYAADIHGSGRHLLSIIDDILDLAKIEAGRADLDERLVTFGRVVEMLDTLFAERFAEAGIDFRLECPQPKPVIRVDERKFSQILINLLSNALKFTPRGGSIALIVGPEADGGLSLKVRDTGIGIAPDQIELVLSPFGQVESAFSRNHHGTGLGLPLAKSITELHGGRLLLESEPGKGTTVTILLPPARVVSLTELEAVRQSAAG